MGHGRNRYETGRGQNPGNHIQYIKVHRQRARELSARTWNEGQNQKVNIRINTTGRPNINNIQDKTNTGRMSHKIKAEKTWTDEKYKHKTYWT